MFKLLSICAQLVVFNYKCTNFVLIFIFVNSVKVFGQNLGLLDFSLNYIQGERESSKMGEEWALLCELHVNKG